MVARMGTSCVSAAFLLLRQHVYFCMLESKYFCTSKVVFFFYLRLLVDFQFFSLRWGLEVYGQ